MLTTALKGPRVFDGQDLDLDPREHSMSTAHAAEVRDHWYWRPLSPLKAHTLYGADGGTVMLRLRSTRAGCGRSADPGC